MPFFMIRMFKGSGPTSESCTVQTFVAADADTSVHEEVTRTVTWFAEQNDGSYMCQIAQRCLLNGVDMFQALTTGEFIQLKDDIPSNAICINNCIIFAFPKTPVEEE